MKKLTILLLTIFISFSSQSDETVVTSYPATRTLIDIGEGDFDKGFRHIVKMGSKGNSSALLLFGMYVSEQENPEGAALYYTKSAKLNNPIAMRILGEGYLKGTFGDRDYNKARFWFEEAAKYGVVRCIFELGIIYRDGLGVEKNLKTSYMWFTIAGILNDPPGPEAYKIEESINEVTKSLSQSEIDDAKNLADNWIKDNLIKEFTIPDIPPPSNYGQ